MGKFLLCVKEWWILTGVAIIYINITVRIIKWVPKMRLKKLSSKIINDYDNIDDPSDFILISKSELMKKYNISKEKAFECMLYLEENKYIYRDTKYPHKLWYQRY
jgi:hypothetical protein